jgi:hypothetical protein
MSGWGSALFGAHLHSRKGPFSSNPKHTIPCLFTGLVKHRHPISLTIIRAYPKRLYIGNVVSASPSFVTALHNFSSKQSQHGLSTSLPVSSPLALRWSHVALSAQPRPHRRRQSCQWLHSLWPRQTVHARSAETRYQFDALLGIARSLYGCILHGRVRWWKSNDDGVHLPRWSGRRGMRWNHESTADWEGCVEAYHVGAGRSDDGGRLIGLV